jgi:hypothetical protein
MHHIKLKIWACIIWIIKQDKAESNQSKLGKRMLHELNMKQNSKQHVVT